VTFLAIVKLFRQGRRCATQSLRRVAVLPADRVDLGEQFRRQRGAPGVQVSSSCAIEVTPMMVLATRQLV
jgi:hypothetical protein